MSRELFYQSSKTSMQLQGHLERFHSFDEFEKVFSQDMLNDDRQVGDYLAKLLDKYDKKASAVSEDAYLATSYVGHIINGKRNNPSRDKLICICFAIGTTEEELQYLLKCSGHAPLYVRRRRDVVIWYGIQKGEKLEVVDDNLTKRGLKPLIEEK